MPLDLEAIRSRHRPRFVQLPQGVVCRTCGLAWPCDAATLAALLTPEALAQAIRIADGSHALGGHVPQWPKAGGAAVIVQQHNLHVAGQVDLPPT